MKAKSLPYGNPIDACFLCLPRINRPSPTTLYGSLVPDKNSSLIGPQKINQNLKPTVFQRSGHRFKNYSNKFNDLGIISLLRKMILSNNVKKMSHFFALKVLKNLPFRCFEDTWVYIFCINDNLLNYTVAMSKYLCKPLHNSYSSQNHLSA